MVSTLFTSSGVRERAVANVQKAWALAERVPFGKVAMSRLVGRLAPYTGSIGAEIVELSVGHAKVVLDDRPALRNHLQSIHAAALANLAELAGNLALAFSMPSDARFIVASLSVEYKKKARGRIVAEGCCPPIPSNVRAEYAVLVTMTDSSGEVVATGSLRTLVGPRR